MDAYSTPLLKRECPHSSVGLHQRGAYLNVGLKRATQMRELLSKERPSAELVSAEVLETPKLTELSCTINNETP